MEYQDGGTYEFVTPYGKATVTLVGFTPKIKEVFNRLTAEAILENYNEEQAKTA